MLNGLGWGSGNLNNSNRHSVESGYLYSMSIVRPSWWLGLSQPCGILLSGYIQWSIQGSVSLTIPLMSMVLIVYVHLMILRRWNALPVLPQDVKHLFFVAMFGAATMLVMYCGIQTWTEVLRVARGTPSIVDWTECDELGHHGLSTGGGWSPVGYTLNRRILLTLHLGLNLRVESHQIEIESRRCDVHRVHIEPFQSKTGLQSLEVLYR